MQKLSEQKIEEKEVSATVTNNDEAVERLNKTVEELKSVVEKIVETSKQTVKEERVEVRRETDTNSDKIGALSDRIKD